MQHLEVSGAVRPIYGSLDIKRLINMKQQSVSVTDFSAKTKGS